MFFQTQVKSLNGGVATDTSGRHLIFIGNLPCQVGDWVWTDGTVIFGHVPPRGIPKPPIFQGNIPALADDNLIDNEGILRGYFKKNGDFKDFDIDSDDFIVNDKRNFLNGKLFLNNQRIVDAAVSSDGELLFAVGGNYRKNNFVQLNNQLFALTHWAVANSDYYKVIKKLDMRTGSLVTYGVDKDDENSSLDFYRNGQLINSVDFKQFADLAENLAVNIKNQIMAESYKEENAVNFVNQPEPPNNFIASSYARIAVLYLHPNGDWDAVITASSYGYCFPYHTFDGSVFWNSFRNNEDKTFSDNLISCVNNFEKTVFRDKSLPFTLNIRQYPDFGADTKDDSGNYTANYKKYILDKVAYYIPLARFRHTRWFPMVFTAFNVVKVHNGNIVQTIFSDAGGGIVDFPQYFPFAYSWSERTFPTINALTYDYKFYKHIPQIKNNWRFPIADNWEYEADGLKILSLHNTQNGKVFSVPADVNTALHFQHYEAYALHPFGCYYGDADPRAQNWTSYSFNDILARYIVKPLPVYDFVNADQTYELQTKVPKTEDGLYLSHWYRYYDDAYQVTDSPWFKYYNDVYQGEELRLSHCFAKLNGDKFLIGVLGGYLLKVHGDSFEPVGYNLHNFRLCELKNINKAKGGKYG